MLIFTIIQAIFH